jgi:hypothetical protein
MAESHDSMLKRRLTAHGEDLWAHPERIVDLDAAAANNTLRYLLELSCRAQHVRNIELARRVLLSMPRPWLLARIDTIAESALDLQDEWQFRRLLELLSLLDSELRRRWAERALKSANPEIEEVGRDFAKR